MFNVKKLLARVLGSAGRGRAPIPRFRPRCETLETRDCPASFLWNPTVTGHLLDGSYAANWLNSSYTTATVAPSTGDNLTFGKVEVAGITYGINSGTCVLPVAAYGSLTTTSSYYGWVVDASTSTGITFSGATVGGSPDFDLNGSSSWDFGTTQLWGTGGTGAGPVIDGGNGYTTTALHIKSGETATFAYVNLGSSIYTGPLTLWVDSGATAVVTTLMSFNDKTSVVKDSGVMTFAGGSSYLGHYQVAGPNMNYVNPLTVYSTGSVEFQPGVDVFQSSINDYGYVTLDNGTVVSQKGWNNNGSQNGSIYIGDGVFNQATGSTFTDNNPAGVGYALVSAGGTINITGAGSDGAANCTGGVYTTVGVDVDTAINFSNGTQVWNLGPTGALNMQHTIISVVLSYGAESISQIQVNYVFTDGLSGTDELSESATGTPGTFSGLVIDFIGSSYGYSSDFATYSTTTGVSDPGSWGAAGLTLSHA